MNAGRVESVNNIIFSLYSTVWDMTRKVGKYIKYKIRKYIKYKMKISENDKHKLFKFTFLWNYLHLLVNDLETKQRDA